MKFSTRTLDILKSFSNINTGMILRAGKTQRTASIDSEIFSEAVIDEDIPYDFGIYDLNQFIGSISILNDPDVKFGTNEMILSGNDMTLNFKSSPLNYIHSPDGPCDLPSIDVSFDLGYSSFQKILKMSSVNGLPHIAISSVKSGAVRVQAINQSDKTSNMASIDVAASGWKGDPFKVHFKTEVFKMIPDDYRVDIHLDGFARFTAKNIPIHYSFAFLVTGDNE